MLGNIMYGFVIFIHVAASIVLILVILLQAGRGGGLSETFAGGSSTQTIFGTKTSVFMTRATAVCACLYLITCLTLAVMTGQRGKSIVAKGPLAPITQNQGQGMPVPLSLPDEF